MNLLEAISFAELKAGGPGSGCRGPHCGRPRDVSKEDIKKLYKKVPAPEPVRIDYPKITPKNAPTKELSTPQKLYRQYLKKQAEGVEKMQLKIPTAKTKDGTHVKEGDIVKVQKPVTVWNMKTGNNDTFPPGTKATILHVLPKVGDADQMLSIQVKRHHEADYVKADDVKLHKQAGPTTIETEPVPKSKTIQSYKSSDGATVTIVKSPKSQEYEPKTLMELAKQPSTYKGQFEQIEKVHGADDNITRIYDTSKVPSYAWGREGAATQPHPGVTLWVHRYPNRITVQEQSYQRWGMKAKGRIEWKYDHPQKFLLQALGMLKKRYGISIPSKETF